MSDAAARPSAHRRLLHALASPNGAISRAGPEGACTRRARARPLGLQRLQRAMRRGRRLHQVRGRTAARLARRARSNHARGARRGGSAQATRPVDGRDRRAVHPRRHRDLVCVWQVGRETWVIRLRPCGLVCVCIVDRLGAWRVWRAARTLPVQASICRPSTPPLIPAPCSVYGEPSGGSSSDFLLSSNQIVPSTASWLPGGALALATTPKAPEANP